MVESLAATSSDDGYGSDSLSSTSFLPMTQEQKEWLIAIVDCDQPKMTSMLNKHPELAGWKTNINGTALHYAVKFGDCAIIRLLLGNYQVPVDAQTYGTTALHLAAASGNEDVIVMLTSMYNAKPDIRDFRGRLPSAYLPKEKDALAKYFPNPLRTLLQNRNNGLYLLVNQPEINSIHMNSSSSDDTSEDHSESGSLLNLPTSAPLPIPPQFPWNQTNQNHAEDLRRGFSFTRTIGPPRQGGRDSSRDRYLNRHPPFGLTSKATFSSGDMKVLNMSFKRPSMKLRCDSPRRNLDSNFSYSDVELINNIYSLVRHKHEMPSLYNPLSPESTKSMDNTQKSACRLAPSSLRSTVGRHWKRNAHSAYASLRNNTSKLTGSTNTIDSDDFTDPPTPTNESNSEQ